MALTDAQIKGLKPKASRYLVSDGRGLSLDVLPSGRLSWLYRYRLNFSYEKVTLGRYPDLTLKAARERRDDLAAQVANGKSPAQEIKKASRQTTIRAIRRLLVISDFVSNRITQPGSLV